MVIRALLATVMLLSSMPAQDRGRGSVAAAVDAYLAPLVETRVFSGSILLARGGTIRAIGGYGKAHFGDNASITTETRFKLMSVTKPFTAIAIMTLQERGKLSLGDPVSEHLASWPETWGGVTLDHLLTHGSGIPNLELDWTVARRGAEERGLALWPRLAEKLAGRKLLFRPGARTRYSNFNYVLLGLVVEAVSGRAYRDYLRSAVLERAGMKQTGVDDGARFPDLAMGYFLGRDGSLRDSRQDMSVIEAAGGLYSTPGDLYRLDRALHGEKLLSADAKKVLFTPVTGVVARGWMVSRVLDRHCVQHGGGANGFVAAFMRFPAADACVIVLSNFAFAPIGRISRDLAAILFGAPYEATSTALSVNLDDWVGLFRGKPPGAPLMIRRSGRRLLSFRLYEGASRSRGQVLVPLENEAFGTAAAGRYRLRLVHEPGGKAQRLRVEDAARAMPVGEMERFEVDPEPWRAMAGTYDVRPRLGDAVTLVVDGGDLEMRIAGRSESVTIVPVTDKHALAFQSETLGTRFEREPAAGNAPVGFVWRSTSGQTFRGTRRDL